MSSSKIEFEFTDPDEILIEVLNQTRDKIIANVRCPICDKPPVVTVNRKNKDFDISVCHSEIVDAIQSYLS